MNSTIMVQKDIKDLAAQRARREGLSLSTVTRFLLKGYADGKLNIGLTIGNIDITDIQEIALDSVTQNKINTSVKKWRNKISNN